MKKWATLFYVLLASTTLFATTQDRQEIKSLAAQIHLAADTTTAATPALQRAKEKLREALALLNQSSGGGDPSPGGDCFKFSYPKYYTSMGSAEATDRAVSACKKIVDLDVAKYVYERNFTSRSAVESMDEASNRSGYDLAGKLSMIKFSYSKYYISLSVVESITRATDAMRTVPVGRDQCLKDLYQKYWVSQSAVEAMDSAAKGCSN